MEEGPTTHNGPLRAPAVFVAHVSRGYEERGRAISAMMGRMGIPFEFMLRGDMSDLTPEVLDTYFTGPVMHTVSPAVSCALKHILICREIIDRGLPGALVLEDDITLSGRFTEVFNRSMTELHSWDEGASRPVIISYEDTRLRFVERSRRRKDTVLYRGDRDRMAGAYYINAAAARLYVDRALGPHFDAPADIMHRRLLDEGLLTYLWCHPTVATQGSHDGSLASSISDARALTRFFKWRFKLMYRKLLYNLR